MDQTPDFEIVVTSKGKRFKMQVTKIYEGDSLQRFKVKGGTKYIVLQSNLPMLLRDNSRKAIDWKLLEGNISTENPKEAAEALNEIILEIEHRIKHL